VQQQADGFTVPTEVGTWAEPREYRRHPRAQFRLTMRPAWQGLQRVPVRSAVQQLRGHEIRTTDDASGS
jgi:hypothetical protein